MASYSKLILSGSTDGKAIKVVATATPGTTIHTGSSTAATLHEVWLYACNTDTSSKKLTIEWGGVASPDDTIELFLEPEQGLVTVIPGLILKGNATPLVVKAFASSANVITVSGYVNEIA